MATAHDLTLHRSWIHPLRVVAGVLCLASIIGNTVIVWEYLYNFAPAERRMLHEAGVGDVWSNAGRSAPASKADSKSENFIKDQTIAMFMASTGVAIASGSMIFLSLAVLATMAASECNHRAVLRYIDEALITHDGQSRESDKGPATIVSKRAMETDDPSANGARSRRRLLSGAIVVSLVIIAAAAISVHTIIQRVRAQQDRQEDSIFVQRMMASFDTKNEPPQPGANFTLPIIKLDLIWVEPGSFEMGGEGEYDGKPITKVTLTRGFWLGKYELTREQYETVMHHIPSGTHGRPDMPAQNISWHMAMEYCEKLTELAHSAGRLPEGWAFTLPTEAQWEYACRASMTNQTSTNLDEVAWYSNGRGYNGELHPVGQKNPIRGVFTIC